MIKLKAKDNYIFGITDKNIEEMRKGHPILINLSDLGGSKEKILIMTGEDEQAITRKLNEDLGLNIPVVAPVPGETLHAVPSGSGKVDTLVRKKKIAVIQIPEDMQGVDMQGHGVHPLVLLNALNMLNKHYSREVLKLAESAVGGDSKRQEEWIDSETKRLLP